MGCGMECGICAMWNEVGCGMWHGMCNVVCGMLCDVE